MTEQEEDPNGNNDHSINDGTKNVEDDDDNDDDVDRIVIIGSGNWGTAIAKLIGENCSRPQQEQQQQQQQPRSSISSRNSRLLVEPTIQLYVHSEQVMVDTKDGNEQRMMELCDVINLYHVNTKYLPGITLPLNIVATSNLIEATTNATLIIFVTPHQFLPSLLPTIRDHVHPTHCRGIHLIKGIGMLCEYI